MSICKPSQRIVMVGLVAAVLLSAQLAFVAGQAAAVTGYGEFTHFGGSGTGDGQLKEPAGVAVEEPSGDVYVVDKGNNRVEKFDAEGGYLSKFNGSDNPKFPGGMLSPTWIAVDNSTGESKGDVYVADSGHDVIDKFSSTGTFILELGGFSEHHKVTGVAVDDAGHLWAVEESTEAEKVVREYTGTLDNTLLKEVQPENERGPSIAVDSQENLYLLRFEPNAAKYDKNGTAVVKQLTTCGCGTDLAIDLGNNALFIDEESKIVRYGPFAEPYVIAPNGELRGEPLETIEGLTSSHGVALNGTTHVLYATQQSANTVAISKTVLLPEVKTGGAKESHRTSVKVEGEVDPDGQEVTTCEFEYGTTTSYGQVTPCSTSPGAGTSPVVVTAELSGLMQATTYHFRLSAGNSNRVRPNFGSDRTFVTEPAIEGLHTLPAGGILGACATLNGSLEPNGYDTHYWFEYGTTGLYGSNTATSDAGEVFEEKKVSSIICGLRPDEIYHNQIVAENVFGKTAGGDVTFRSVVLSPVVSGVPSAGFVTAQTAVLSANLNPEHAPTRFHFEYGPCPTLTDCTAVQSTADEMSAVYGEIGASAEIVGLAPSTTYSYRLVADNEFEESGDKFGGSAAGSEGATFTTAAAAIPSVATGGFGEQTSTSTVISGTVEPNGVPTSYSFEAGIYNGAATQYGVVASASAGAGVVPMAVSTELTGLQPGTTYAYRLSVSSGYILNASHSLQGASVLFTTPGLPMVLPPPLLLAQLPAPPIAFPKEPGSPCKKGYKRSRSGKCLKQEPKKRKKVRKARKKKARRKK
jgi:NHL repeat